MGSRQKERVHEEFDPTTERERDSAADILKVYLPGFRKEQLKVQVITTRFLRISGERELGDNKGIKFRKEIPISSNYDPNQISAKFENGILFIKHPKIIIPDRQPPAEPPKPPAQPPKDAPKPPKAQPPPKIESPRPPQPKAQSPEQEKLKQPPPLPVIESPEPELPKFEFDAANTCKNEIPDKVEQKKSSSDEINASGITNVVDANMKRGYVAGDSASVGTDNVGVLNYRQVLSEVVKELKNPKKLMESVITVFLVIILCLPAMMMKPINKYFKKSEN